MTPEGKWQLHDFMAKIRLITKPEHNVSHATRYDTFTDAKCALVERTKQEIESHKKRLADAIKLLKRVEKMEEPTP